MHRRNLRKFEQFQDRIARLYPDESLTNDNDYKGGRLKALSKSVTFQVTDKCNLECTYCYQINKSTRRMSFETAKKLVDLILSGDKGFKDYINPETSPALILEFIGGEPFLEIDLISQICDYAFKEMIRLNHPWADKWMISICSNGTLYSDERVQRFLYKYRNRMSFSITIDGDKELHDSCRVFPDGSPSYDIAIAGAKDWMSKGYYMGSKITISPYNLKYLVTAIKHMVELGYEEINANCVYEEGWTTKHATDFYWKLKEVADYFIDNRLVEDIYLSLFVDTFFKPKKENDLENWCGGTGAMLSCDPDGYLYPCIRYMESSIGPDRIPYRIGSVDEGIGECTEYCDRIHCLDCINRRTESTDECFYCPIAEGCSWCSAYNYQVNGTPDSRVTYICCMHKARALANAYYWSRYYDYSGSDEVYELHVPKEWALEIIPEEEWNYLISLPHIKLIEEIPYSKRVATEE